MSPGLCSCHNFHMSDRWIDSWLGAARFQRYVDACEGDRARALELYEWNLTASQVLMRDLAHFEIALRNAYDAAITAHWPHHTHWLLHPESPAVMPIWRTRDIGGMKRGTDVNSLTRKSVDDAIRRCGFGRATAGKVIAALSFGFWRQLTTNAMEKSVWVPYLHHAFPPGTSRTTINTQIEASNRLRNRIAHHESLISSTLDLRAIHGGMMDCLRAVSPRAHHYVLRTSAVAAVLDSRPESPTSIRD